MPRRGRSASEIFTYACAKGMFYGGSSSSLKVSAESLLRGPSFTNSNGVSVKEALEASVPSSLAADQVLNRPRGLEQQTIAKPAPTHRRIASSSSYSAGIVADSSKPAPLDLPPSSFRQNQPGVASPSSIHSSGKLMRQTSRSSMATFGSFDIQAPNSPGDRSGRQSMDTFRDNSISLQRSEIRSAKEEEFDALLTSGHTMKVSLTPSRLKRFDVSLLCSMLSKKGIEYQPICIPN